MTLVFHLFLFFFNDTATTEIYTLSLHDALPISRHVRPREQHSGEQQLPAARRGARAARRAPLQGARDAGALEDRKSTRLNSSHANISYAVFCLKKKKINEEDYSKHL